MFSRTCAIACPYITKDANIGTHRHTSGTQVSGDQDQGIINAPELACSSGQIPDGLRPKSGLASIQRGRQVVSSFILHGYNLGLEEFAHTRARA